jgi:hypothetical protein
MAFALQYPAQHWRTGRMSDLSLCRFSAPLLLRPLISSAREQAKALR